MPFGHKAGLPPSKKYLLMRQPLIKIGATGFEPATSRPPAERATKLRHTPRTEIIIPETGKKATGKYRQKHTEKEKDPQIPQVLSIFF